MIGLELCRVCDSLLHHNDLTFLQTDPVRIRVVCSDCHARYIVDGQGDLVGASGAALAPG